MHTRFEYQPYHAAFHHPIETAHGCWSQRVGILIRLTTDSGDCRLGEIAPLPLWGSETNEEALAFCGRLPPRIDESVVRSVPSSLPCCSFALETAWESLRHPAPPIPVRNLALAALLPAGPDAIAEARSAAAHGFFTFKWKVGVHHAEVELQLLPQVLDVLPPEGRLRLDANGAWDTTTARRWLGACSGRPIEYVEQPLPPGQDEAILSLASEFPTQIALDESVARHSDLLRWLEFGWPGIYVIKPSLAGSPSRLLHLLEGYEAEAVFSSAFETAVGARAAMLLSTHASGAPRPIGFGSAACFADDRWNLALRGPTISSKALARLDISHVWDLSLQTPSAS